VDKNSSAARSVSKRAHQEKVLAGGTFQDGEKEKKICLRTVGEEEILGELRKMGKSGHSLPLATHEKKKGTQQRKPAV